MRILYHPRKIRITSDTYIYLYIDDSASMDTAKNSLTYMVNNQLKDALLPMYDYNESEYFDKVQIHLYEWERTFNMLNLLGQQFPLQENEKVIVFVFQDEAASHLFTSSPNYAQYHHHLLEEYQPIRQGFYDMDISNLRNSLNSFFQNYYRGIVFQVVTNQPYGDAVFPYFLQDVKAGNGEFSGSWGLSDKPEISLELGITNAETPSYYLNKILNALRQNGYNI